MKKTLIMALSMLVLVNCGHDSEKNKAFMKKSYLLFEGSTKPKPSKDVVVKTHKKEEKKLIATVETEEKNLTPELDFEVENNTGKTIYVACFSYIQKVRFIRWHWDKSPVYKMSPGDKITINIDTIPDDEHRDDVFGYLAIFENEKDAHDSIYELVKDTRKVDLDRLSHLKDKTVSISIEKYGVRTEKYDFEITDKYKEKATPPELDFIVENKTGKTIFVAGFIYQTEDNIRSTWEYEKTSVLRLENGESSLMNVNTIYLPRDRGYMHGYLGVFEEHEEQLAHDSTYELLLSKNRITLGRLAKLRNKKVIIQVESYGSVGDITEFDIKPAQSPFSKKK